MTYKLSGVAKRWWQAKKVLFVLELGSEQTFTWEMFKDAFNKHFFFRVVQEAKARKFMDLTQGGMSVTSWFVQLSRLLLTLFWMKRRRPRSLREV
jgi:hypothetical protein